MSLSLRGGRPVTMTMTMMMMMMMMGMAMMMFLRFLIAPFSDYNVCYSSKLKICRKAARSCFPTVYLKEERTPGEL